MNTHLFYQALFNTKTLFLGKEVNLRLILASAWSETIRISFWSGHKKELDF